MHQRHPPVVDAEVTKRKSFLRRLSFSKSANGTSSFLSDPSSPPVPTTRPPLPKNRSVTAPVSYRGPGQIGGQPYEQIAPARGTPPSRRVSHNAEPAPQVPAKALARLEIRDRPPLGAQPGSAPRSPPLQRQGPPRSPPIQREPLRSPPIQREPLLSPPIQRPPAPRSPPIQQPPRPPPDQRQPSQRSPPSQRQPIRPALASPPTSPPRPGNASSPYDASLRHSTLPPPLQFGPGPQGLTPSSSPPARPLRPIRSSSHRAQPIDPNRPSPFARSNPPSPATAPGLPPIASPPPKPIPNPITAPPLAPTANSPPVSPPRAAPAPGPNVSEASAYALAHRVPSTSRNPSSSPPAMERRVSRPLPRPPSVIGKSASGADMVLLSSSPSRPARPPSDLLPPSFPVIDFPRSPTLPQLVDPRNRSPAMSPISPSTSQTFRKAARRPKRLTLVYLLSLPRVQTRLLPVLPVNSFLSLVGAAPDIRKAFTGEAVGRWVTREWGIKVDSVRGRSWPNLTVWEGFREFPVWTQLTTVEALLHNPATYHTYPPKWHSLLQHLCLSYTLVVLHLRSLPAVCFPDMPLDEEPLEAVAPAEPTLAGLSRMARHERLVELVMPSPLSSAPPAELNPEPSLHRRGSMASMSSAASFSFPRKRANSLMPSSASIKPPPAYPTPKRYGFKSGDGTKSRGSSESGRPGSVFSYQSSPSIRPSVQFRQKNLLRASFASSDPGRLSPKPVLPTRVEPIFDQPPPYTLGRAPVLRVFVPLSERVPRWPSAEGALWTVKELDKCGATKRLKLGDLVINTAIRPQGTEHILMFVPFVKHLLVPLEYTQNRMGHLPSYIDAFALPPSYYQTLLTPIILFLDIAPFVVQAMTALRLAYDRRDVTVSSGARVTAKRYIHVTGFEVQPTQGIAPEWQGIVSLEAEGTVEGKAEMEKRLGGGDPRRAIKGPWEIVREKSMRGNVWLRLVHTT